MAGQRAHGGNPLPAWSATMASLAAFTLLVFMASSLFLAGPAAAESGDADNDPGITQPGEPDPAPVEPGPEDPAPVDPVVPPPYTPPVAPPPYTPPAAPAPRPAAPAPKPAAPQRPADSSTGSPDEQADPNTAPTEELAAQETASGSPETSKAATPSATPAPSTSVPATTAPSAPGNVDSDKASATSGTSATPRWLQLAVIVLLLAAGWAYTRFMRRGSRHLNTATASEDAK